MIIIKLMDLTIVIDFFNYDNYITYRRKSISKCKKISKVNYQSNKFSSKAVIKKKLLFEIYKIIRNENDCSMKI